MTVPGAGERPKSGNHPESIFIHLHTLDLRTHDSPILSLAHSSSKRDVTHFLPVYVFDERQLSLACIPGFGSLGPKKHGQDDDDTSTTQAKQTDVIPGPRSRNAGLHRMGRHRVRFLVESVFDLKERYKRMGSDLLVACGEPEDVVAKLAQGFKSQGKRVDGVYMQKEVATEEVNVIRRARKMLGGIQLQVVDSRTLVHPEDLPFKIAHVPDVYTKFRKEVENLGNEMIRPTLPDVDKIKPFPELPSKLDVYQVPQEVASTKYFLPYALAPLLAAPALGDRNEARPIPKTHDEWRKLATSLPGLDERSAFPFHGGESTGLARLDDYIGSTKGGKSGLGEGGEKAQHYKETRNEMVGEHFSTKFSAWLALGCLSARTIGNRVLQLQDRLREERALSKQVEGNTYWILFELLWRDYFFFVSERFSHLRPFSNKKRSSPLDEFTGQEGGTSSALFNLGGFQEVLSKKPPGQWKGYNLEKSDDRLRAFLEGRTGVPFLDACMRELAATGYMSNRGRQNVASFLAVDLYIDWRPAAEWFETMLIDHDVYSNWGNWQYQAGVGNDPRASRQFNPIKQAADYDNDGKFTRRWLPELKEVPAERLQTPWLLPEDEKHKLLGNYPFHPLAEQQSWKKHYHRADNRNMDGARGSRDGRGRGGGGGGRGRGGGGGRGGGRGQPHQN